MKKCKGCSKSFKTDNPRQKFHSKNCLINFNSKINNNKNNRSNYELHKTIFHIEINKKECLKCLNIFLSEGKWNRLCKKCKNLNEFDSGSVLSVYT